MTNKELRKLLKKFPDNAKVRLWDGRELVECPVVREKVSFSKGKPHGIVLIE